jgi:hypothetical protein
MKRICWLLFILLIGPQATAVAQWNTIFSDDFDRPDGPVGEPWVFVGDTLYIHENRVIGSTGEYGRMEYTSSDSTLSAMMEADFSFGDDANDGRLHFLMGGTPYGPEGGAYIAKIDQASFELWSHPPEVLLDESYCSFAASTVYSMRLRYDHDDGRASLIIWDSEESIIDSLGAVGPPVYFKKIMAGIENQGDYTKWLDNIAFKGTGSAATEPATWGAIKALYK